MNLADLARVGFSLEAESSTGKSDVEREYVYYARLNDRDFLHNAISVEMHEQFELPLPAKEGSSARMRLRKTVQEGQDSVKYVQTLKIDKPVSDGLHVCDQVAVEVSRELFNQLLSLYGQSGMRKRRYTVPVKPGDSKAGLWEIDVFVDRAGQPSSDWVKIDFEVPVDGPSQRPSLPSSFSGVINSDTDIQAQKQTIGELYSDVFITDLSE